jgi:hypothetical protein
MRSSLSQVFITIAILNDFTRRRRVKSFTRVSLHLANDLGLLYITDCLDH